MPVLGHAIADDLAVEHAESRKERRSAMAGVVVSLSRWDSRSQRKQRLCALQSLNLALLVYAQHKGLFRRVEVKPNNIHQFLDEVLVSTEFERFDQMRLEVVHVPDAADAGLREMLRLGHGARTPVRGIDRLGVERGFYNRADLG